MTKKTADLKCYPSGKNCHAKFINPVFAKTIPFSFSVMENERFGSINSGTGLKHVAEVIDESVF
jgi:hypothetical protein